MRHKAVKSLKDINFFVSHQAESAFFAAIQPVLKTDKSSQDNGLGDRMWRLINQMLFYVKRIF